MGRARLSVRTSSQFVLSAWLLFSDADCPTSTRRIGALVGDEPERLYGQGDRDRMWHLSSNEATAHSLNRNSAVARQALKVLAHPVLGPIAQDHRFSATQPSARVGRVQGFVVEHVNNPSEQQTMATQTSLASDVFIGERVSLNYLSQSYPVPPATLNCAARARAYCHPKSSRSSCRLTANLNPSLHKRAAGLKAE